MEYITPAVEFTGEENMYNYLNKYRLCFYGRVESLLMFGLYGITDIKCGLFIDGTHQIELPIRVKYSGEYTHVYFTPVDTNTTAINATSDLITIKILFGYDKYDKSRDDKIYILGLCHKINKISNGIWIDKGSVDLS